ncbi:ATP-binding protein [Streptomyces sp. NPDC096198]|uniref:ATP-binding protein n=1 Tax=Streptomyces sp. NPDC096198 TaxID=3366080 RepID=UPI003810C37A
MLRIDDVDPGAGHHQVPRVNCSPDTHPFDGVIPAEKRPGRVDERVELWLRRTAASVGKARAFVRAVLPVEQLRHRIDDITPCVSELATNAVLHGSPAGHLILVRVIAHEALLRIEVHDAGESHPLPKAPADDDPSGRGLFLVEALADDWGAAPRDGLGKLVWVEFTLPADVSVHQPLSC